MTTCCGLIVTMFLLLVVFLYSAIQFAILIDFGNTTYGETNKPNWIGIDDVYTYTDTNFAVAIGLVNQNFNAKKKVANEDFNRYFRV